MYAIIETGGKQIRVTTGDVIYVEKLNAQAGDSVEFKALLFSREDEVRVGKPALEDVKVKGVVQGQVKGQKIIVYKYKAKKNYRRKAGHRQPYTRVEIQSIEA